jgi:phosphoribosylanthranilate isomerase
VHNWELSRQVRISSKCPVFLAGGLKPENVRQAIETVRPFGVDVCSGVRTEGNLDIQKLENFFKEVLQISMIKPSVL